MTISIIKLMEMSFQTAISRQFDEIFHQFGENFRQIENQSGLQKYCTP